MIHLLLVIIYLAFISLGLPDSLLGCAWPTMYQQFNVPISYAGIISMIIAAGTVISSLQSDRLTKKLGTGRVMVISVAITAVALLGFAYSPSFILLCLCAVPYGLGAGSVDASLNNYVALHYASRHMSWLHCMWGVGASVGPYIMSFALLRGRSYGSGYLYIAILQFALTLILFISLPLWKKQKSAESVTSEHQKPLKLKEILQIRGVKEVLICFFCYSTVEQTVGLWASSYMVLGKSISTALATEFASLFFIGITVGRGISGFITMKLSDTAMIRLGQAIIAAGILCLFLPFGQVFTFTGLILIGLGCAPIYPCIIHSTPTCFGEDKSQAIIGVQMAFAYIGTCVMPPLFGLIANYISIMLLPVYLVIALGLMIWMHERLKHITKRI